MNITEQLKDKLNEAVKAIFEGYNENTKIAEDGVELLQDFIDTYGLENKMLYVDSGFVWVNDVVLDTWQLDIMQEGEALKAKHIAHGGNSTVVFAKLVFVQLH